MGTAKGKPGEKNVLASLRSALALLHFSPGADHAPSGQKAAAKDLVQIADNPPGRLFAPHFCRTQEPMRTRFGARVKTYTPLAITDQCADTITHRGPRTSNGSSILTRPSVGRS
jgi:hypothetical protein